jgi:adenosylmethionine---8-amino-7-oxononanoate aminotransferase
LPHVGDVRQRGLMAGVELVSDKANKAPYPWADQVGARVCARARDSGLLIRPLGDVLVIMPPLAIHLEQLDEMLDVMIECVREVTGGSS